MTRLNWIRAEPRKSNLRQKGCDVMFRRLLVVLLLVACTFPLLSAEYLGENIDGTEYDCDAYSYSTGKYYSTTVSFSGTEVTMTFSNGGYIYLEIDDEEIDDPSSISAYDYDRGVYWDLTLYGLD